jgi:23S rRNA (adenine2503-C2)-methyltransferase
MRNPPPFDIRSATLPETEAILSAYEEPSFRAAQVFSWVHQHGAGSFDEMTNRPAALRRKLSERCRFSRFETAGKSASQAGEATKYLFALEDNTIIESVFMRRGHRKTLCVSAQAGCRMGCVFCASAVGGLSRNLTAGEMCAQVYQTQKEEHQTIDHIVMMGCGEPLDNYDASLRFISLICHPQGRGIAGRNITLSTCGLVPQIDRLSTEALPLTLAVSLHAPNDGLRAQIMPVARKYSINETLAACTSYFIKAGRRVTFEYALIDGVNDQNAHARELAALLRGMPCHINLIPVNETGSPYKKSRRAAVFAAILTERGVNATVRHSMGGDIDAACGQLRRRYIQTT